MKSVDQVLEDISKSGDLTEEDVIGLGEMLKSTPFKRFLNALNKKSDDMGDVLLAVNLSTEEGVRNAIAYQGMARGLAAAVQEFLELLVKSEIISNFAPGENEDGTESKPNTSSSATANPGPDSSE